MSESDPNCNSIECFTHHTMYEKEDDVVQYPESSAETLDSDLKDTQANIAAAEAKLGKWDFALAHAGYVQTGEQHGHRMHARHHHSKNWRHDWTKNRFHFRNNYKDWPVKRKERFLEWDQQMDNWGTMRY